MDSSIAGYEISKRLEEYFSSSLYLGVRLEDGGRVLIKTLNAAYPSNQDIARIKREFRVLEKLQGVDGVIAVRELEVQGADNPAIIFEAFGQPLSHLPRPPSGSRST